MATFEISQLLPYGFNCITFYFTTFYSSRRKKSKRQNEICYLGKLFFFHFCVYKFIWTFFHFIVYFRDHLHDFSPLFSTWIQVTLLICHESEVFSWLCNLAFNWKHLMHSPFSSSSTSAPPFGLLRFSPLPGRPPLGSPVL